MRFGKDHRTPVISRGGGYTEATLMFPKLLVLTSNIVASRVCISSGVSSLQCCPTSVSVSACPVCLVTCDLELYSSDNFVA